MNMKSPYSNPEKRSKAGTHQPSGNMTAYTQGRAERTRLPSGRSVMPSDKPVIPSDKPRMPSDWPMMPSDKPVMPSDYEHPAPRPSVPSAPAAPLPSDAPTTVQSPYFTAGFLRNFLGKSMRVEFLIGTSGALIDRMGILVEVGASYIVLRPLLSDDLVMCDLYSIKFVTIYS